MADCTGGYKDGCETNLNTDIANCEVVHHDLHHRRRHAAVRDSASARSSPVTRTRRSAELQWYRGGRLRDQHLEQLEPLRRVHRAQGTNCSTAFAERQWALRE